MAANKSLDPDRFWRLHELAFNMIPLLPREKPAAIPWLEFQTRHATEAEIDRWSRDPRGLNVGVVTGRTSCNRIVLDVDSERALQNLEHRFGPLPMTPRVRTSRGWHIYFVDLTASLRNFAGRIEGVDLRGQGGYVVGAGSVHPTGFIYVWDPSPEDVAFSDAPEWIYELASRSGREDDDQGASSFTPPWSDGWVPPRVGLYARRALEAACFELENTGLHTRNDKLNALAFTLGRLVGSRALDAHQVEVGLLQACHANGLVEDDGERSVRATLRSGLEAGQRHPRDLSFLSAGLRSRHFSKRSHGPSAGL